MEDIDIQLERAEFRAKQMEITVRSVRRDVEEARATLCLKQVELDAQLVLLGEAKGLVKLARFVDIHALTLRRLQRSNTFCSSRVIRAWKSNSLFSLLSEQRSLENLGEVLQLLTQMPDQKDGPKTTKS